ncbi:MAG: hypothetical protein V3U67_04465 [Gemmatimonadota bacterium]
MRRPISLLLAGVALLLTTSVANAQDASVADPDHYVVEFENDHVRVLRVTYGPNESSVLHEHPKNVVVALTDGGVWKMTGADGEASELRIGAGEVVWADATVHMPQNMSDGTQEVIIVELKMDHMKRMDHEAHMERMDHEAKDDYDDDEDDAEDDD